MKHDRTRVLCIAALLAAAIGSVAAPDDRAPQRQSRPPWRLVVGGISAPDYIGSDDRAPFPLPVLGVTWRDRVYVDSRDGLGVHAFQTPRIAVSGGVSYDLGRDSDLNDRLDGLDDVDPSVTVNVYTQYRLGPTLLHLDAERHIGGSDGLQAHLAIELPIPLARSRGPRNGAGGPPPTLTLSGTLDWADERYNEAFFGVRSDETAESGLDEYDVNGGLVFFGAGVDLLYPIGPQWFLSAFADYRRPVDSIADSPLVDTDNQFIFGIVSIHSF